MTNPLKGEVEVRAGGQDLVLAFDYDIMARMERRFDEKIGAVLNKLGVEMWLDELKIFFWFGLQTHQPKITEKQVGPLIAEISPIVAVLKVSEAIQLAFPIKGDVPDEESEGGEGAEDPQSPASEPTPAGPSSDTSASGSNWD